MKQRTPYNESVYVCSSDPIYLQSHFIQTDYTWHLTLKLTCGLGLGPFGGSCGHGNEHSGYKGGEFIECLSVLLAS